VGAAGTSAVPNPCILPRASPGGASARRSPDPVPEGGGWSGASLPARRPAIATLTPPPPPEPAPGPASAGSPAFPGWPWVPRRIVIEAGLAVASAAVAAAAVVKLARDLPATNQAHTDIVGYPIFADFSASRYPDVWYLTVIGWPLLGLLVFLVGRRVLRAAGLLGKPGFAVHAGRALPAPPPEPPVDPGSPTERTALAARVAAVALVWGLAGAIVRDNQGSRFWRDLVVIAAAYCVLLLLAAAALSARGAGRSPWLSGVRAVSTLNALGAALTIGGLLAVSQRTTLTTLSDNVQHPMHWLPLALGVVLTAVSVGVVGICLWRGSGAGPGRVRTIERRALFLVAVPVAIFLSTAVLTGALGAWDNFESGQEIATLRLLHLGAVPYRDFLPYHGLLVDTFFNALGYRLLSASAWGAFAGTALILTPLNWVALYLFAYRVAGACWAALLTVVLLIFNTTLMVGGDRLMFWPLILVLLAIALDRRSRIASFFVGATAVLFAVLVPEASYAVPACGIALLARDAYHAGWPRVRLLRDFGLTLGAIAGGAVVLVALFAVLASQHAVGGFVDFYVTQVPGHGLEGALPISFTPLTQQFLYWVVAPGAASLLVAAILAIRVRRRLALRTNDFLMMAAAVFAVLYYAGEFLGRADFPHSALAYTGAIPLVMLCAWEAAMWLNGWVRARLRGSDAGGLRWPLFYVVAVIAGITTTTSIPSVIAAAPTDFRATAATEPWLSSMGYVSDSEEPLVDDVGTFLSAFLKPGEEIFDFSNQPGLYFYTLYYRPASRHFVTTTDGNQASQEETISDLETSRPEFAVLFGTAPGSLSIYDGIPNAVRDYDTSEYLLDHYRPLADVDGQIIYVRDGAPVTIPASLQSELGPALDVTDVPFQYPDCAWGYIPEFLNVRPPAGESGVVVGGGRAPTIDWALSEPSGHSWADYRWMELTIASGSPGASFVLSDQEVPGENHDITFQTLPGGQASYTFPIGACPQWHGYTLPTLSLSISSGPAVAITQIKLLP